MTTDRTGQMAQQHLTATGLTCTFGPVRALRNVDLAVAAGEVRALAGANGSGKSTLIKALAGVNRVQGSPTLTVAGHEARFPMSPGDFDALGIYCVHQDLGLIEELTVLDNFELLHMTKVHGLRIGRRDVRRGAQEALSWAGVDGDTEQRITDLSRSERALVALARAYWALQLHTAETGRSGVLILDEITAFLPRHEVKVLQRAIAHVSGDGHAVIFVSHDLDEVLDGSDSVTILRDGRLIGTHQSQSLTRETLVSEIVGRALANPDDGSRSSERAAGRTELATFSNLSSGPLLDASFTLHRGEILGFTGVLGSGFEEIPYLLYGQLRGSGTIIQDGNEYTPKSYATTKLRAGELGLVPGDRRAQGLFMDLDIAENLGSLHLSRQGALTPVRWRPLRRRAADQIREYGVVTTSADIPPTKLSGGNQQKVLLAKWLSSANSVLLLHEPVQGVDVGARASIVELLAAASAAGLSIICASSDYELLATLCDRVVVMGHGRIRGEVARQDNIRIDKAALVRLSIADS